MIYYIYKLTDKNNKVYYGSTINPMQRRRGHKNIYNSSISREMEEPLKMEIIEGGIPYKHIAHIREGYYIRNFNCINVKNPDRWWSLLNRKDMIHNYYERNKEHILAKSRERYNKNKEKKLKQLREKYTKKPRKLNKRSWGGDERYDNNLLLISPDIFQ